MTEDESQNATGMYNPFSFFYPSNKKEGFKKEKELYIFARSYKQAKMLDKLTNMLAWRVKVLDGEVKMLARLAKMFAHKK